MRKQEETRVFNPILLIAAVLVAAIALFAGYWLTRKQVVTPTTQGPAIRVVEEGEKRKPEPEPTDSRPAEGPIRSSHNRDEPSAPPPPDVIEGTVFDGTTANPVSDATVQAAAQGQPPLEVNTGPDGKFHFDGMAGMEWAIRASKAGFASVSAQTNGAVSHPSQLPAALNVLLRLAPAASLEGKVLNAIGKAIPDATVQVFDGWNAAGVRVSAPVQRRNDKAGELSFLSVGNPLAETGTNAEGIFRFEDLEAGSYNLVAFARGYSRKTVLRAQTGSTDTVFRLDPEVRVSGQVRAAPSGSPIPGATISVTIKTSDSPEVFGTITTGATGSYSIGGLPRRFSLAMRASHNAAESALYEISFSGGISQYKQDLLIFEKRRITGTVVEAFEGKPIAGLGVLHGTRLKKPSIAAQTDSNGRFEVLTSLTDNGISLEAKEGLEQVSLSANFQGDEESIDLGIIELVPGVKVSGRVVTDKKASVAGALVRALPVEGNLLNLSSIPNVRSNPGGDFVLPLVPPGRYYLSAESPGYKTGYYGDPRPATEGAHPILNVLPGKPLQGLQIQVTAATPFSLKGRVIDATGTAISGAQIVLEPAGVAPGSGGPRATSREDGTFELKDIPGARYRLTAEKTGYWPTLIDRVQPESKAFSTDIVVILEEKVSLTISGKVTDSRGSPLNRAEVLAFAGRMESLFASGILTESLLPSWRGWQAMDVSQSLASEKTGGGKVVKTQGDGTYTLKELRPGKYTVMALQPHTGATDILFDVDAGASGVDFQLEADAVLRGTVLLPDGKTPCRSFILEAFPEGGGTIPELEGKIGEKVTNRVQSEDGSFELGGLYPGQFTLNVQSPGQGEASLAFEIVKGETPPEVNVVLNSGGSITGRVVGSDGQPAADATVVLGEIRRAVSPDGSFAFLGLPPDRYALMVVHPDYAPSILPNVPVQQGQPNNVGTIQLGQGGTIEGTVRFSSGAGAADYVIHAEPTGGLLDPNDADLFVTRTDDSGHFRLSNIGQGHYRLCLRNPGNVGALAQSGLGNILQSRFVQVAEGELEKLDLVVDSGARVTGRVTVNGKPFGGSTLVLYPRFRTEVTEYTTVTDQLGYYSMEGVPPGSYEAVVGAYSAEDERSVTLSVPDLPNFVQNFAF